MRFLSLVTTTVIAAVVLAQAQEPAKKPVQMEEAKGMPPRAAPTDYPSQGKAGDVTIAAEFSGHSVPRPEGPLSTENFIVVETGLFGATGEHLNLGTDQFSLRVNGKKAPLPSEPYGLVVSNLRDPEWVSPEEIARKKEKEEGGKGGLSMNGQGNSDSTPLFVHIPIEMQRSMAEYVRKASLPEGDRELPVAGLLFFPYRGNTKSIHSLELTYSGPNGKVTIPLQP